MVMSHMKPRAGSLASLGPMPPTLFLSIDKWGLDDAHKDKQNKAYSADFRVSLFMDRMGGSGVSATTNRTGEIGMGGTGIQIGGMGGQESPSESSEADSSECDTTGDTTGDEDGESGNTVYRVQKKELQEQNQSQSQQFKFIITGESTYL